jgi:glycosyltransferase involved in cell wall biosynthesis
LRPTVSVVVPVFESAARLPELVARIESALRAAGRPFELVLVNDASRDGSWDVVLALARDRPWLRAVDLARNVGQHGAVLCGTRLARGELVVTLDDDLQHPPEEIPRLLARLESGYDLVYGTPRETRQGPARRAASRVVRWVLGRFAGLRAAPLASAFRAFRGELREDFGDVGGRLVCFDVLLGRAAGRIDAVAVEHHPRRHGRSKQSLAKLVAVALGAFRLSRRRSARARPAEVTAPAYEIRTLVGGE